jgi:hopanoid biosynthesis associated protein HpnK
MKRVVVTADDFGLSEAVNEGVERAHRDGVLTHASLMMAGAAVGDAVARARRLPGLRVGLHLVVIEGPGVLGSFGSDQLRLGVSYYFSAAARRRLAAEIRAQFEAFAATGLVLDHADAHKHMHMHPTVGRMMIEIGREFGLRAVRVPSEPPEVMAACGEAESAGARAMYAWSGVLRRQVRQAGMAANDAVFGLAWSGHVTAERVLALIPHLPEGVSELYFHPAAGRDAVIDAVMPTYEHEAELAALLDPRVRTALESGGVVRCGYGDLA